MSLTAVILIIVAVIAAVLVVLFLLFGRGEGRFTFDIGGAAPRAEGGTDTSSDTGFKERLTGLGVFAVGVIGVLTARLWSMCCAAFFPQFLSKGILWPRMTGWPWSRRRVPRWCISPAPCRRVCAAGSWMTAGG